MYKQFQTENLSRNMLKRGLRRLVTTELIFYSQIPAVIQFVIHLFGLLQCFSSWAHIP